MRKIEFSPRKGIAPKAVRKGSKTETIIKLGMRPQGVTLTAGAKAISKTGAECSPQYFRAWVAESYLAPLGYGVRSEPTKNGKDLVIYVYPAKGKLDTSRSDVRKAPAKRKAKAKAEAPAQAEAPAAKEGEAA